METPSRYEQECNRRLELLQQARGLATMDWREGPPTIEAAHQQSIAISLVLIADALRGFQETGIGVEPLGRFT